MCRHAAYVGAPEPLSTLLYDAPHSLEVQSYRPREMLSGHVNVDGTGVAWWAAGEDAPLSYVSERPPWSDANLPHLAPRLRGAPIVAAVRSQTPGMPTGAGAAHPFVVQRWAGTHNGYLEGFSGVSKALVERVDGELLEHLGVLSDARVLFLGAVSLARRGATLQEALLQTAANAAALCDAQGSAASLNLVLADATQVVALRAAQGVAANSLHVLAQGARWPQGNLVASEALDDDPGWRRVDENRLVTLSAAGVEVATVSL